MASKKNKNKKKIEDIEEKLKVEEIKKETEKVNDKETTVDKTKKVSTNKKTKEETKSKDNINSNEKSIENKETKEKEDSKEKNTSNSSEKSSKKKKTKKENTSSKESISNDETKKEEVKDKNENKQDEKKEESSKKLINTEEKQKELIKNRECQNKKRTYIILNVFIITILVLVFSSIFALINLNNSNIVKGVKIKNIDVSNLSLEDAKTKINETISIELLPEIKLKYNDFENTIKPSNIEFSYKIDESIKDAYNVGRNGNILINNYQLLFTAFFGNNVDLEPIYNEEVFNSTIDNIAATIPGVVVNPSYYIEDGELIVNKGTAGIKVNKEELKNRIIEKIKNRNASDILLENKNSETIEIPVENTEPDNIDMCKIYQEIYKEPQDAYFIKEPFQIIAESDGVDLEMTVEDAQKIVDSENKDEYRFTLKITKPQKTVKDLGAEAFPYTITKFSTRYDITNTNRTGNLEIAAGKINGTVLMPGESFSFNAVVGKRTIEEGYKNAKIYQNGEVVDGLAGGICQVSSTLYNAVLLANLQVDERYNHSFKTSYLAAGKDATVVYGVKDFKFTNTRNYPIKIDVTVQSGVLEFVINGIKEEEEYEVKILPTITQTIPYATQEIIDPTLAPGSRVVVQKGSSGCKVTTWKETRLNGVVTEREIISNDTYNALKSIVRVGP